MYKQKQEQTIIVINSGKKFKLTYSITIIVFEQAFLANEDLGDSLDSVEALFKKHDDFEKSLAAQEEKIKVCCKSLKILISSVFHSK